MEEHKRIILRTYGNAWKFEKKIYTLGDIKLWIPINLTQLSWLGVGLVIMVCLAQIIPILEDLPVWVLYGACPFGIMKLLTRVKFHGKPTVLWIKGFIQHLLAPVRMERFGSTERARKAAFTNVVFRH